MRTLEEKIESLVTLAKAAGRYLNADEPGDYQREARQKLWEAYVDFCDWRHDEPDVLVQCQHIDKTYTDEQTGVQLRVESHNPEHPGHPKLTLIWPLDRVISHKQVDQARARLLDMAGLPADALSPIVLTWSENMK